MQCYSTSSYSASQLVFHGYFPSASERTNVLKHNALVFVGLYGLELSTADKITPADSQLEFKNPLITVYE